jgi:hypothetical protein
VRLSPLGTSPTKWSIVPAPDDRWWWLWSSRWNENWQGEPKYSEKTCPIATLSTTNPTWPDPGSNPCRRGGKPATNRLSYDTALQKGLVKWVRNSWRVGQGWPYFVPLLPLVVITVFLSGLHNQCLFIWIYLCFYRNTLSLLFITGLFRVCIQIYGLRKCKIILPSSKNCIIGSNYINDYSTVQCLHNFISLVLEI